MPRSNLTPRSNRGRTPLQVGRAMPLRRWQTKEPPTEFAAGAPVVVLREQFGELPETNSDHTVEGDLSAFRVRLDSSLFPKGANAQIGDSGSGGFINRRKNRHHLLARPAEGSALPTGSAICTAGSKATGDRAQRGMNSARQHTRTTRWTMPSVTPRPCVRS